MAEVFPFNGIRYSRDLAGSMHLLTTPPYDVIDRDAQKEFYARHPYNVIRLELGQSFPGDTDLENRYTRAARFYRDWLARDILAAEGRAVMYVYEQEFSFAGAKRRRHALLASVKVEDYSRGVILPHEETLPKAKADRLQLLKECKVNFSPIFGIYVDREGEINRLLEQEEPEPDNGLLYSFTDDEGVRHRLTAIDRPGSLERLQAFFLAKSIFIADGHHRYETAVQFARERHVKGDSGCDRVLMALTNVYDPGLVVLPTHRVIKGLNKWEPVRFLEELSRRFAISEVSLPGHGDQDATTFLGEVERARADKMTMGIYLGRGKAYAVSLNFPAAELDDLPVAWRDLDVAVLQTLIFEPLLGLDRGALEGEKHITYTRDAFLCLNQVDAGNAQLSILLNPTRVEQVIAVAEAGSKMPQKSTFFYPKLITGMAFHSLG